MGTSLKFCYPIENQEDKIHVIKGNSISIWCRYFTPHNAKAHYNLANLYKDKDDIKGAINHYKEAIKLYPIHSSSRNNLATLQHDQ